MADSVLLKSDPKIEFQMLEHGFQLIDDHSQENSGFYAYSELRSIELNKTWFPLLAKYLRAFTWILNGVPLFPNAESYKKSKIIFHFGKSKIGVWLTDTTMVGKAKKIKQMLDARMNKQI